MSASAIDVANTLAKELFELAENKQFAELNVKLSSKRGEDRKSLYILIHEFNATRLSETEKDALTKILIQHHANSQSISSSSQVNIDYLLAMKDMIEPCSYLKIFVDPNSSCSLLGRLLRCGADASINSRGSNALHHLFSDLDKTSLLLEYGCNINSVSASGFGTPVHIIIANEYEKHFFNILERAKKARSHEQQFDYTIQDGDGKTILVLATRVLKFEIIKFILDDKAIAPERYIDIQDKHGRTALHYACALGQLKIAMLLVQNGANIYITDKKGFTPFHYANNDKEMVRQLLIDIKIDPDRHRDAQCNSFTTLLKKNSRLATSTTILPAYFLKAQRIIASRFKNDSTATASSYFGSDYQETLICQENTSAYKYILFMANPEELMAKMDSVQKAQFKTQVVDAMSSEQRIALQTLAKLLDEQWKLMGDSDVSLSEQCLKGHQLIRSFLLKEHDNSDIFGAFKDAHTMIHSLIKEGDSRQVEVSYINEFFSLYPPKILELNQKTKNVNFQNQCLKQLDKLKDEVWALLQERSKQKPLTFTLSSAVQSELAGQSKSGADNDNDQGNKHEKKSGF